MYVSNYPPIKNKLKKKRKKEIEFPLSPSVPLSFPLKNSAFTPHEHTYTQRKWQIYCMTFHDKLTKVVEKK